jgi:hypothetical protein
MSSDSILALRPLAAVDVSASIVSAGEIARMVPKTWSDGKAQEGKKMGDERSDGDAARATEFCHSALSGNFSSLSPFITPSIRARSGLAPPLQ